MRLISWNVNGLRAVLKKGFAAFVRAERPDVLCLQETRATPEQAGLELPGYMAHWNAGERGGYAGVAVLTRAEPLAVTCGLAPGSPDPEGRVITLEYPDWFVVNVYTPNSQRGLTRLEYRTQRWDPAFLRYVKRLDAVRPVIFCGDLNVAHREIDLAHPQSNVRTAGFTPQERANFDRLLGCGFIDTFREFTPEGGHYTWWAAFANARARNLGWRIDYVCISAALRPRLRAATILPHVMGSDHCPVSAVVA